MTAGIRAEGKAMLRDLAAATAPMTIASFAKATGRNPVAVRRTMRRALMSGYVEDVICGGNITWRVTAAGRAAMGEPEELMPTEPTAKREPESDRIVAQAIRTQPRWVFDAALFRVNKKHS